MHACYGKYDTQHTYDTHTLTGSLAECVCMYVCMSGASTACTLIGLTEKVTVNAMRIDLHGIHTRTHTITGPQLRACARGGGPVDKLSARVR